VRKQLENKTYLFSGPIMDNDRVRGIVIVNTASEEHARGAERRPHDQKWQSSFRIASDGIPEHATGDALKYT
jgi:hypothetical protein